MARVYHDGRGVVRTGLGNVVPLRPAVRVNPSHPALQPPDLFDQDDPDVHAADRCVLLTRVEEKALRSVLEMARLRLSDLAARGEASLPFTIGAVDQAIQLLDVAAGRPIDPLHPEGA